MAHALIFGASGISGWAVAKQCLEYPTNDAFARVTAVTNRQYTREELLLPRNPRLQIVGGIDLNKSVDGIAEVLQTNVPGIENVTHVFYMAYVEVSDLAARKQINTDMLRNAMEAVLNLAGERVRVVVLQTGAKYYGVDMPDRVEIKPPLMEDAPWISGAPAENNFYYSQVDVLKDLAAEAKHFKFYEVRPDVIVGFTPSNNAFNLAQGLAFFFTLFREVYGEGAEVPFVGSQQAWTNSHMDSSQDIIAKQQIHVALHSDGIASGTGFNSVDNDTITTWEQNWPQLAAHFGLKGVGPGPLPLDVGTFAMMNLEKWKGLEKQRALRSGLFEKFNWPFITGVCAWYHVDRQLDVFNSKKYGFEERQEVVEGYRVAWERMREARIIP